MDIEITLCINYNLGNTKGGGNWCMQVDLLSNTKTKISIQDIFLDNLVNNLPSFLCSFCWIIEIYDRILSNGVDILQSVSVILTNPCQ